MIRKTILTSIFKRKGGEGANTKLIKEHFNLFSKINYNIYENESPILLYFVYNELWILFTDARIVINENNQQINVCYDELIDVKPALAEEIKMGNKASDFTKLLLNLNNKSSIVIDVEKGSPYKGIYQMLHYISSSNKHEK
ncbi:hypothetical protein HNP38_003293 [Chryseobacterium defluvii]|uniref:PH (Pleckstrin Homology) domain-containing protein n=1 Tax=Chryseobacterium defluvii TaxID=160396 RepID=A0A840KKA9_9FLAO|nr:hypothetical protein [Chryseobacterium defluvii]MBB4807953.1 hypothetical protein [Chryseobacterium defluvii]